MTKTETIMRDLGPDRSVSGTNTKKKVDPPSPITTMTVTSVSCESHLLNGKSHLLAH